MDQLGLNKRVQVISMKCFKCAYLYININDKNKYPIKNFRYQTCFCKCDCLDKPLNIITEEELDKCHFIERKQI